MNTQNELIQFILDNKEKLVSIKPDSSKNLMFKFEEYTINVCQNEFGGVILYKEKNSNDNP